MVLGQASSLERRARPSGWYKERRNGAKSFKRPALLLLGLTMLVLAASVASLLAAVQAKQSLSVEVAGTYVASVSFDRLSSSAPSDFTIDTLQLTTSVVNTGDEEITLLRDPRTPLSSWATNTFAVSHESGAIPTFKGVQVRYSPDQAATLGEAQLTTLAPGESLDVSHEVGKYYNCTLISFNASSGYETRVLLVTSSGEGTYTFEPTNVFTSVAEDGTFGQIIAETAPATVSLSGILASSQPFSASSVGGAERVSKGRKRASYVSCSSTRQVSSRTAVSVQITDVEF